MREMFVTIHLADRRLGVPLSQLEVLAAKGETRTAFCVCSIITALSVSLIWKRSLQPVARRAVVPDSLDERGVYG